MGTRIYRFLLRLILNIYLGLVWLASKFRSRPRPRRNKLEVLITGTFYSDQWLITHLKPLALANNVGVVKMVAVTPVPEMENVQPIYPPHWLMKTVGAVPARLLMFSYVALKTKPDVVAGFHILINGLFAILLSKCIGARSLYICGGGPMEVLGGGYATENRIFNRIEYPDNRIESQLINAIKYVDYVITMGTSAIEFFKSKGVDTCFEIVAGGFSHKDFARAPETVKKEYDLILVGRLSAVKQVDLFLDSIVQLEHLLPNITAVIVGDGPDREALEKHAKQLGLENAVHFAGWQQNVGEWLQKSKVFVLTSESEGLSQALIQAFMVGLPAVVSNVGDLGDLVDSGVNGVLVDDLTAEEFAQAYYRCLADDEQYQTMAEAAYQASKKYRVANVADHWDRIFDAWK